MATTFIDRGYLRPVTFDYDNIKGTGIIRLDTNKKFESAACSITETIMTEEYLLERLVYRMYTRYSEEFHPKKEYVLKCDCPESENAEFCKNLILEFIDKINEDYDNILIEKKDS